MGRPAPPPPLAPEEPSPPAPEEPLEPTRREKRAAKRGGGRKIDLLIGIPLGLLLGIGIVTAFVFLGSEGTIDAPRIDQGGAGATGATGSTRAPNQPQAPAAPPAAPVTPAPPAPLPVVRIEGSVPPLAAGAVKIEATKGKPVRFRIDSDGPVSIEIVGTGFTQDVSDGEVVTFTPAQSGQFPTFVSGNDVNVATFDVTP